MHSKVPCVDNRMPFCRHRLLMPPSNQLSQHCIHISFMVGVAIGLIHHMFRHPVHRLNLPSQGRTKLRNYRQSLRHAQTRIRCLLGDKRQLGLDQVAQGLIQF